MTEFVKDDSHKLEPSLIPWVALHEVAAVFTHGRYKYDKANFEKCPDISRYVNAMERHILAYRAGEAFDYDSGLHHLAHAAACAMIMLHMELSKDFDRAKRRLRDAIYLGILAKEKREDVTNT